MSWQRFEAGEGEAIDVFIVDHGFHTVLYIPKDALALSDHQNAKILGDQFVDVEEESNLAKEYGVVSVPTIVLFKEGEVVEIIVGAMPLHSFEKKVKESYGI